MNSTVDGLRAQIKRLPNTSGVYLFKNRQGNVLYVGKAKALKQRVQSYVRVRADLGERKELMIRQTTQLDWIETATETDAVVLEDQLIKDYQPRFNILSKDDKSFLYIHITDEKFPRVLAVRQPNVRDPGYFYGPYPFAHSIRVILKLVHMVFPFRTCRQLPKKACLEYYIGRCQAPCIGKISPTDYQHMIDSVVNFFEGESAELIMQTETAMENASAAQAFEQAAQYRDQLTAIAKLRSYQKSSRDYLQEYYRHTAIDPAQGLSELQQALGVSMGARAANSSPLRRVEIYDISNIQGEHAVGSMVVFIDGIPAKSEYRRFKIKTVRGADDFKSMQEVVRRRLRRDWPLPNLVIMDGGKGQLSAVQSLWNDVGVPAVALAKRREELFIPNASIPLTLPAGSQGLFLVQRMRDEAHRFAITYYRKLHAKTMRA